MLPQAFISSFRCYNISAKNGVVSSLVVSTHRDFWITFYFSLLFSILTTFLYKLKNLP